MSLTQDNPPITACPCVQGSIEKQNESLVDNLVETPSPQIPFHIGIDEDSNVVDKKGSGLIAVLGGVVFG